MFADGTDEILGKFITLILITTDDAAPDGFALFGLTDSLGFRFDVLLIVIVGGRRHIGKRLHLGDETDEKDMRTQINGLLHIDRKVGVRAASDCQRSIAETAAVGEVGKLIDRVPALESKMLKQFEIGLLADDRDGETSRTLDKLGGVILLAQGHG